MQNVLTKLDDASQRLRIARAHGSARPADVSGTPTSARQAVGPAKVRGRSSQTQQLIAAGAAVVWIAAFVQSFFDEVTGSTHDSED